MTPDLIPYAEVNELHRKHVSGDVSFGDGRATSLRPQPASPFSRSGIAIAARCIGGTAALYLVIFAYGAMA